MNVVFVVHGHFEDENIRPLYLGIHHLAIQIVDVRHPEISGHILTVGKLHITLDAPLALLHGDDRIPFDDVIASRLPVPAVDETHMGIVQRIVDVVKIIADPIQTHHVQADLRIFKLRVSRQRRRFVFAHIPEDQTQIFSYGIAWNLDFLRERFLLRRLFHTLTGAVVLPAVVEATKTVSFDPADGQLGSPMRATKADHVWRPALAAIERKIFSENANRRGAPRSQLMGAVKRLPKHPQVFTGEILGSGMNEIQLFYRCIHDLSKEPASNFSFEGQLRPSAQSKSQRYGSTMEAL